MAISLGSVRSYRNATRPAPGSPARPATAPGSTPRTSGAAPSAWIVAYVLGPGLGSLIFNGFSRLGGANALEMALTGTILIVIIALVFDALLVLLGRLTISKGLS